MKESSLSLKDSIDRIIKGTRQEKHRAYQDEADQLKSQNIPFIEPNFKSSIIAAFYKLKKAIKSGDSVKKYEAIQEAGAAKLIEIEKIGAALIGEGKLFLELAEDKNEPVGAFKRRLQDLINLPKDIRSYVLNKENNFELDTLCTLTKLLTYTGIIPTYTLKSERINEIYSGRIQLINKLFTAPNFVSLYEEIKQINFQNEDEEHTFWRDIHDNLDILHFSLEQGLNLTDTQTTVISRRKNLVSTVEKLIRKNPTLIQSAQTVSIEFVEKNQHLKNLKEDLKRTQNPERKDLLEAEIKRCEQEIHNLNLKIQAFRNQFMEVINDLFGITLISENEKDFDPQRASDHIRNFQAVHKTKMLHIADALDQKRDGILKNSLEAVYNSFDSVKNKTDPIAQVSKENNRLIQEIFNSLNVDEVEEILKGDLNPVHRNIFSLIFFAKKAGWQIADVSDYLGIYKVDDKNRPAHSGLQIQFIDDTGKRFEIQIKDRTMYNSSTVGYGSHEAYKGRTVGKSLQSMCHSIGAAVVKKWQEKGILTDYTRPNI